MDKMRATVQLIDDNNEITSPIIETLDTRALSIPNFPFDENRTLARPRGMGHGN